MSRQLNVILFVLAMIGLVGPHPSNHAQDSTPKMVDEGQSGEPVGSHSGDTIFLQDDDGEFRRVPLDHLDRSMRDPSHDNPEIVQPDVPEYFFSKLELDGIAHRDWVDLTASLSVHLVTPDKWINVPVRFDQASLLDFKHSGPGEISAPAGNQPSQGLSWLLRGAGDHQLQMMLRVPLRKTLSGDLLQLELPEMTLFTGKLNLQLPSASVTIRTEESVRLLGTRVEGEHTILNAELPGKRVDLRWNIHEQLVEPIMQKPTDVRLRLVEGKIELTARQQLQFGTNTSDTLRVRLPSEDLELNLDGVRIIDANGNERWIKPTPTEQPGWVALQLGNSVGKMVQIHWGFSTPMPAEGRDIVIDGFEVADARRQSGTIAIENADGFRITQSGEDDFGVERINVSNLATSSLQSTSQAYAFAGPQFRLRLRIEPTIPVVSATPYYFVNVSQDCIELEAIYQLSIDGGTVRSLPIAWSDKDRNSWDVVASSLTGGLPRKIFHENANSPDQWEIAIPDAVENRVEAGLSAIRYFETYPPEDSVILSLPTLSNVRGLSGWIIVSTDDDVEVSIRAANATVLTTQAESVLNSLKIPRPDWSLTQPLVPYRFSTNRDELAPELEMDLTVQSQTITTSAVIEVHDFEGRPRVSQRLSYDVQFGRVSQVRLKIPPLLYDQLPPEFRDASLQFLFNNEVPLTSDWSGSEVTIALPTRQLGKFDIVIADYALFSTLKEGAVSLMVPVITSLDQPFSSVRLIIPDQPTHAVAINDTTWTRLTTIPEGIQWITSAPITEVTVSLDWSIKRSPQRIKIEKTYLQTSIDDSGHQITHGTFIVPDSLDELVVQLPSDAVNISLEWNGVAVDSDQAGSDSNGRTVRLKKPASLSTRIYPQVVKLSYHCPRKSEHWSDGQTVSFPVFAPGVFIEHLFWELTLPPSHHLFLPPSSMTPQFHWVREGIVWKRQPFEYANQLCASIREVDDDYPVSSANSGNSYLFGTSGSLHDVEFHTMSKSGIVFLGAGVTLFASFLLIKVPAVRHPMIWLGVCLFIMLVSLWYLEPLLVLLQPAIYGLALPLCAGIVEYAINGQRHRMRENSSDSTYHDAGLYPSGVSGVGEPPVPSTFVRPVVMSDSGINL